MRRLTNNQMDILALSALDKLEELHNERVNAIYESEEYQNFEDQCDDNTVKHLKKKLEAIEQIDNEIKILDELKEKIYLELKQDFPDYHFPGYHIAKGIRNNIESRLNSLKKEKFKIPTFDRDKLLTKIKAEVILSSIADPNELIKEVTDKFKN